MLISYYFNIFYYKVLISKTFSLPQTFLYRNIKTNVMLILLKGLSKLICLNSSMVTQLIQLNSSMVTQLIQLNYYATFRNISIITDKRFI